MAASLVNRLKAAFDALVTGPSADADSSTSESNASKVAAPGVAPTDDMATLKQGMDDIRSGLRRYGSALGAGATAVLAGLGYSTVNNLFPLPYGREWGIGIGALFAALFALGGVGVVVSRIFAAQRQIILKPADFEARFFTAPFDTSVDCAAQRSKIAGRNDLTGAEAGLAFSVLAEHAAEQSARDMRTLELRAYRFDRVARHTATDKDAAKSFSAESDRLETVLALAGRRTCAALLQRRSIDAYRGRLTLFAMALAVVGTGALFALADFSQGQRNLVELRDTCAKAELVDSAVDACAPVGPAPAKPGDDAKPTPTPPSIIACASAFAQASGIPDKAKQAAILSCAGVSP